MPLSSAGRAGAERQHRAGSKGSLHTTQNLLTCEEDGHQEGQSRLGDLEGPGLFVTPALVLQPLRPSGRTEPTKHRTVQVIEGNAGSTLQPGISQKLPSPTLCLTHVPVSVSWLPHQEGLCTGLGLALERARRGEGKCCHVVLPQAQAGDEEAGGRELSPGWAMSRWLQPRREAPRAVSKCVRCQDFQSQVQQEQCWLPRGKPPVGCRQLAVPALAAAPPYSWPHSGPRVDTEAS